MQYELTDDMILAIGVAFDEMDNADEWSLHLNEHQLSRVESGKNAAEASIQKRYYELLEQTSK